MESEKIKEQIRTILNNNNVVFEPKVVEDIYSLFQMKLEEITGSKDIPPMNRRIIINGRQHTYPFNEISYSDLIALAFGGAKKNVDYILTYSQHTNENLQGNIIRGQTVKVENGQIFNIIEPPPVV